MKIFKLFIISIMLFYFSGCTTIYGVAVDERELSSIKNDTALKATVMKKLADDDSVKLFDLSVSVYLGHVYLIGQSENDTQKEKAVQIAGSVAGVTGVTPFILTKADNPSCGLKQNLKISATYKARLLKDKAIRSTNVQYKTMQCRLVIWGTVRTAEEKSRAENLVGNIENLREAVSFLKSTQ